MAICDFYRGGLAKLCAFILCAKEHTHGQRLRRMDRYWRC